CKHPSVRAPETKYAKSSDGVHIAYQECGDGPLDIVMVPGFVSHVELIWEIPFARQQFEYLASYARLIRFDKRGTGLSDRHLGIPTLEQRMDDVRAVMDAAGSEHATLYGVSEGGPMCILFAATYPERTDALVLSGSFAKLASGPDQPFGQSPEALEAQKQLMVEHWGTGAIFSAFAPGSELDDDVLELFARGERNAARPGDLDQVVRMCIEIDVRPVLPTITVPTLIQHVAGDTIVSVEHGRYLADHIPDATYIEYEGRDHMTVDETERLGQLENMREFLTGTRAAPDFDRVLATVLFTDIVSSTERAAQVGDAAWKRVLDQHDEIMQTQIGRFRGRAVKSTGDGFLAVFDGPGRAAQCALAAKDALRKLDIDIRAGVHTGEIEQRGDDVGGIAVHIGARIASKADAGEVLASRVVRDLVVGSSLEFSERGAHELKGVPGSWELYAVAV
ncbi:MAG TPA: alpha/beta fold hydrolase, partial [Acidimicrobiia bacterium]|nr:alpha/beta fold hydrolase [Acidimicrobiia bacterium]